LQLVVDEDRALAAKDVKTNEAAAQDDADTGGPARGAGKRRRALLIVALVALAAGAGWGGYWWLYGRYLVSTDDAFIDAQIVRIAAQEAGQLVELPVDSNTHVAEGDLLARIDPSFAEATLAQADANVAKAETGVTAADADVSQARAAVTRQKSAARAAEVTATNARRIADRYSAIVKDSENKAISQQQLDTSEAEASSAEAQAAEAQTAVAEAEAGVTAAEAALASAKAALAVARANRQEAEVTRSHLTITAPIAGEIVQRNVGLGSYVAPGTQIMALVPDEVYVTANFKETQLPGLKPGLPVDIKVDAYPDAAFHGKVVSIQKGAGQAFQLLPPQNATGNFVKVVQRVPVRISIEAEEAGDYVLGPGMSVVPTVHLEKP